MSQPENIRVSIIDPDSPVSTVRVDGIVDTVTSKEVERAIEGLISRDKHRIVMDLAGVDYISSAGWGVFISHLKEAREHSGDLRLSGMIPNVREIFELLEFDTILNSFENSSQAAQSFERDMPELEGGPRAPAQTSNGGLDELAAIGVDAPPAGAEADSSNSRFESTRSSATQLRSREPATQGQPDKHFGAGGDSSRTSEEALEVLVVEDPFATISELKSALQSSLGDTGGDAISWWWVFRALWRQGLLSKRARFKLARRRSQKSHQSSHK